MLKILLPILVVLILVLTGVVYSKNQEKIKKQARLYVSPLPSKAVAITKEPTPVTKFDRSKISVLILNGVGKAGVASQAKKVLEDAGYKNIEIGNAEKFTFNETIIQLKSDKESYRSSIIDDLSNFYTISPEKAVLKDNNQSDLVIIIGGNQTENNSQPEEESSENAEDQSSDN